MKKSNEILQPDWAEKHPFPPEEKRPAKLLPTTIPRIYGSYPNRVPTWMHLSTNMLTHAEFALSAGTHFAPPDIHAGDEIYYVLDGAVEVHQPESGQVVTAKTNHVLHIPKGTPHVSYNFGNAKARILTFFAPRIWATPEDQLSLKSENAQVVTPGYGGWNGDFQFPGNPPVPPFSKLGHFPVDGPWSRDNGLMTAVPPERALRFIHGQREQILLRIFVDNDFITVGTMTLRPNSQSDSEKHAGDEVLHVLSGELSVEINPDVTSGVSVPRFELKAGEKLFIPQGTSQRYDNFDSNPAEFVFAVAPQYGWGEKI